MTAEIALLNKKAVALAADSAVTIRNHNASPKIYTSVNKLFQLSKLHPVGIMIYGQAEFMEYPWETLIKEYRNNLADKSFPTVYDYSKDFINYLKRNNLFSLDCQEDALISKCYSFYNFLKREIDDEIKQQLKESGEITAVKIKSVISNIITSHLDNLKKTKFAIGFMNKDLAILKNKYDKRINKTIQKIFDKLPLSIADKKNLKDIIYFLLTKDVYPDNVCGVVISGFGSQQIFPAIVEINLDIVVNNKPRYKIIDSKEISLETTAIIRPFAQSEMVYMFVEGVDPIYQNYIDRSFQMILQQMPDEIVKIIPKLTSNEKNDLAIKLKNVNELLHKDLLRITNEYRKETHIDPVLETVSSLPYTELAEMAESLVNLTSFKRRMSLDTETVGGPIDVALISKGDGLVWMNRKHHFKPELNHHFFANYYNFKKKGT